MAESNTLSLEVGLSDAARREICNLVASETTSAMTRILAELSSKGLGVAPAALKAREAARYLGISRSGFYNLLEIDRTLAAASIYVGKARVWPREALDNFLRNNKGKEIDIPSKSRNGEAA